jgi:hypothetical protein
MNDSVQESIKFGVYSGRGRCGTRLTSEVEDVVVTNIEGLIRSRRGIVNENVIGWEVRREIALNGMNTKGVNKKVIVRQETRGIRIVVGRTLKKIGYGICIRMSESLWEEVFSSREDTERVLIGRFFEDSTNDARSVKGRCGASGVSGRQFIGRRCLGNCPANIAQRLIGRRAGRMMLYFSPL